MSAPTEMTVDDLLVKLRDMFPYRVNFEIYTDADVGWEVFCDGPDEVIHTCASTILQALQEVVLQAEDVLK